MLILPANPRQDIHILSPQNTLSLAQVMVESFEAAVDLRRVAQYYVPWMNQSLATGCCLLFKRPGLLLGDFLQARRGKTFSACASEAAWWPKLIESVEEKNTRTHLQGFQGPFGCGTSTPCEALLACKACAAQVWQWQWIDQGVYTLRPATGRRVHFNPSRRIWEGLVLEGFWDLCFAQLGETIGLRFPTVRWLICKNNKVICWTLRHVVWWFVWFCLFSHNIKTITSRIWLIFVQVSEKQIQDQIRSEMFTQIVAGKLQNIGERSSLHVCWSLSITKHEFYPNKARKLGEFPRQVSFVWFCLSFFGFSHPLVQLVGV